MSVPGLIGIDRTREMLQRVRAATTPLAMDRLVSKVAAETQAELVKATPKKWFGEVRRGWSTKKPELGVRVVHNPHPAMRFIEFGTKDHGPVTKRFLYIPLTRRAAAGWHEGLIRGVDFILRKRVKGIQARHIVEKERPRARARLLESLKNHIRGAIHGN